MQEQPSEKLYDMVDINDRVIGTATKEQIRAQGQWRRMVHIFIFNKDGELLICKRPMTVAAYPGKWTSSAGGHVELSQTYDQAAEQELKEELGLDESLTDLGRFDVSDERGNVIHHLFKASYDGEFLPAKAEIEECRLANLKVLEKDVSTNPDKYAEPFKKALALYISLTKNL